MKKLAKAMILVGCICWLCSGCQKKPVIQPAPQAQKESATIVSRYLVKDGLWETCTRFQDGSIATWDGNFGNPGDVFTLWHKKNTYYLQNPD